MPKPGMRKINRYYETFKATAVKLSKLKGVLTRDVAEELDIHPFMLSRWFKEIREDKIAAKNKKVAPDPETTRGLKRLKKLEKDYRRLKMEHELLKKAIRFCSEQKLTSLPHQTEPGKIACQSDVCFLRRKSLWILRLEEAWEERA